VYSTETGEATVSNMGASNVGKTLTLKHTTNIPEGTYHLAATERGKTESARTPITVIN
jgi:hypothetical protein